MSKRDKLVERNTDSPQAIQIRLESAAVVLEMAEHYDHVVVNHNLDDTVAAVRTIVNQYRK